MDKPYFRDPFGFVRDCATGERVHTTPPEEQIGDEQVRPPSPAPDRTSVVSDYDPFARL